MTIQTREQFQSFINGVTASNPALGHMINFVFQQLRKTEKDTAIANELLKQYEAGNIVEIKITAYELGYNG